MELVKCTMSSLSHEKNNGCTLSPCSAEETVFDENISDLIIPYNTEEPEALTLLEMCRNIHKQRLSELENKELDLNTKNEAKISILKSYLQQVEEQNDILTSTMIELEKEVQKRVKQMEKRLKHSAKTTMEAVINIHECEKEMRRLVEEWLSMESIVNNMQHHLSSLKVENRFLRDQNSNLNHDVQALLHVIHHARSTGHWEMNCITFCEVTPEQIFGPVQSMSYLYSNESTQSEFHLHEGEQKELNSNFQSQDVSNFNRSTPSVCHHLQLPDEDPNMKLHFTIDDKYNEILEKDKKIAVLESQISELQQQLTLKETECECHMWKLEILMQHNQNIGHVFSSTSPPMDTSMQKCISLPDIGNIYSYTKFLRRYRSCQALGYEANFPASPIKKQYHRKYAHNKKSFHINFGEKSGSKFCRFSNLKHDHIHGVHKAQSEPYLFMFGDDVYAYRPCEPSKEASDVALCHGYQLSLPPSQSIDLKFPIDGPNLRICDSDLIHKSNISCGIPDSMYYKVGKKSSSHNSNDSFHEENLEVLCSTNNFLHMYKNIHIDHSSYRNCSSGKMVYNSDVDIYKKSCLKSSGSSKISLGIQTENKVDFQSVGLQVNIADNEGIDLLNSNLFELDLSQLRKTVKILRENILKAENKAEAKCILVEQLQRHITSTVKEVEIKNQALRNVEKKLESSRNECSVLKGNISSLNSEIQQLLKDIENLQMLNDNLQLKIELQNQTIQNLQEALVKTKHASNNVFSNIPSSSFLSYNTFNKTKHSSRGSVVDI